MSYPRIDTVAPTVRRGLVTAITGDAATLPNHGVVTITSTSGNVTHTLRPPKSGSELAMIALAVGGGTITVNANSTGTSFTTTGANQLTLDAAKEAVILRGLSPSAWMIASNHNSVGVATRST